MKKHLTSFVMLAAAVLASSVLVGCGDEVQELESNVENRDEAVAETTADENCTLFSTGDDGTRTWMNTSRNFFWSEGDQIYVNTEGEKFAKTSESRLATDSRTADFVLKGVRLTEPKCSVVYIGNGTTAATANKNDLKVKIEAEQTQTAWGNSDHIGASGDCGATEAEKVGNKYSFTLRHKAAYLIFQPYRPTGTENPDWKLMKIEIISNNGTTLAGEYPFGTGELNVSGATNTANTVTLLCNGDGSTTGGFTLGTSASAANSCFVVIQPDYHELTIRYTVKVTKKPDVLYFDANGINENGIFFIDKTIAARPYSANGVTTIKHQLSLSLPHHQWDALNPFGSSTGTEHSTIGYPTTDSEVATCCAQNSCKDMPNANEMYWYVVNGDPHWDATTSWSIDGGLTEYTKGMWVKKKQTILDEGLQFSSTVGKDNVDMRLVFKNHGVQPSHDVLPAAERSKYFFLPTLGFSLDGTLRFLGSTGGYYWSSSSRPGFDDLAYNMQVGGGGILITNSYRDRGYPVGAQWFK